MPSILGLFAILLLVLILPLLVKKVEENLEMFYSRWVPWP